MGPRQDGRGERARCREGVDKDRTEECRKIFDGILRSHNDPRITRMEERMADAMQDRMEDQDNEDQQHESGGDSSSSSSSSSSDDEEEKDQQDMNVNATVPALARRRRKWDDGIQEMNREVLRGNDPTINRIMRDIPQLAKPKGYQVRD